MKYDLKIVIFPSSLRLIVTYLTFVQAIETSDEVKEESSDVVPIALSIAAGGILAWTIINFGSTDQSPPPRPFTLRKPTRSDRKITMQELTDANGRGPSGRILIAVKGDVFDVTSHPSGVEFYGPEGPYASFAGKDATVGLALSSYDAEDFEGKSIDDPSIGYWEREQLEEWYHTFLRKYDIVGVLETETTTPKGVGPIDGNEEVASNECATDSRKPAGS